MIEKTIKLEILPPDHNFIKKSADIWHVNFTHHQIATFFIVCEVGSQKFLPDRNLALKSSYRTGFWLSNIITRRVNQAEHFRP